MDSKLENLLRDPRIWRGARAAPDSAPTGLPTGFDFLDEHLPGGGWPDGALIELVAERHGIGELQLLMPALAYLSRQRGHGGAGGEESPRWIVWVAPPHIPYAPALAAAGIDLAKVLLVRASTPADVLWAAEQALRSTACAVVLLWLARARDRELRRLQLAAEEGASWGVMFRPPRALARASPAALRLRLAPTSQGTALEVIKCRGGRPGMLHQRLARIFHPGGERAEARAASSPKRDETSGPLPHAP